MFLILSWIQEAFIVTFITLWKKGTNMLTHDPYPYSISWLIIEHTAAHFILKLTTWLYTMFTVWQYYFQFSPTKQILQFGVNSVLIYVYLCLFVVKIIVWLFTRICMFVCLFFRFMLNRKQILIHMLKKISNIIHAHCNTFNKPHAKNL